MASSMSTSNHPQLCAALAAPGAAPGAAGMQRPFDIPLVPFEIPLASSDATTRSLAKASVAEPPDTPRSYTSSHSDGSSDDEDDEYQAFLREMAGDYDGPSESDDDSEDEAESGGAGPEPPLQATANRIQAAAAGKISISELSDANTAASSGPASPKSGGGCTGSAEGSDYGGSPTLVAEEKERMDEGSDHDARADGEDSSPESDEDDDDDEEDAAYAEFLRDFAGPDASCDSSEASDAEDEEDEENEDEEEAVDEEQPAPEKAAEQATLKATPERAIENEDEDEEKVTEQAALKATPEASPGPVDSPEAPEPAAPAVIPSATKLDEAKASQALAAGSHACPEAGGGAGAVTQADSPEEYKDLCLGTADAPPPGPSLLLTRALVGCNIMGRRREQHAPGSRPHSSLGSGQPSPEDLRRDGLRRIAAVKAAQARDLLALSQFEGNGPEARTQCMNARLDLIREVRHIEAQLSSLR